MSMTCMECFKDFQKYEIMLTRAQTEVLARRRELFQLLDGDLFYKMRDWQKDFVKIFWSNMARNSGHAPAICLSGFSYEKLFIPNKRKF